MRFARQTKIFRGQLDAAPFLAVFFLLIIFLLLNSSLVFTPGVPINLPSADDLPGTDKPTVVVAIDDSGQLYFEQQVIEETRLQQELRRLATTALEPLTLVVQADRGVTYGRLLRVGLLAEAAGIKTAILAVRPVVVPGPSLTD
jgi:biopolymer transport protein ExbD